MWYEVLSHWRRDKCSRFIVGQGLSVDAAVVSGVDAPGEVSGNDGVHAAQGSKLWPGKYKSSHRNNLQVQALDCGSVNILQPFFSDVDRFCC